MDFHILQGATYPYLKYGITNNMLRNNHILLSKDDSVAVTFSMYDETGNFIILNESGKFEINTDYNYNFDYFLVFEFSDIDTSRVGIFMGEFVIDILNKNQKLKVPLFDKINIYIKPTKTKTEVKH